MEPIIEALVGRILEVAIAEVLEEEELAGLRARQANFQKVNTDCLKQRALTMLHCGKQEACRKVIHGMTHALNIGRAQDDKQVCLGIDALHP